MKKMFYEKKFPDHRVITCVSKVFHENGYIVQNLHNNSAQIIDPGDCFDQICYQVELHDLKPNYILLTHGHFDHILSAHQLSEFYNIPVLISSNDFKLMRRASLYAFKIIQKKVNIPKVIFFDDENSSILKKENIHILPIPGHTQGSVCISYDDFIFTGDTLFFEHLGPTNYPESSIDDLFQSVENIVISKNKDATIFSGHGRPWIISAAQEWFNSIDRTKAPQYLILNDPSLQPKGLKS